MGFRHFVGMAGIAVALAASPAAARDLSKIKGDFENTGIEPEALGSLKAGFKLSRSQIELRAKQLAPNAMYSVRVAGEEKAQILTDGGGNAKVKFRGPTATSSAFLLDFDPRGQVLSINDGANDVLTAVVSGAGQPSGMSVDERVRLTPTSLVPNGEAKARYRTRKDGRIDFEVEIAGVAAGSYLLFIDGVERGTIVADALGIGEIEFESPAEAGDLLLDFDPRGLQVDVSQNGNVYFTGEMRADAQGVTICTYSETTVILPSSGADPDGSAEAELRTREDCEQSFSVEAEDIPVGAYDVKVGGVTKGTLTVIDDGVKVQGEIEFEDGALDFDPNGQTIEISQGATVFFSGPFTGGVTGGGDAQCTPSEVELPLLNAGVYLTGSGDTDTRVRVDCDRSFSVEIEDVPVGAYDVRVDGVIRGSLTVAFDGIQNRGEVEFETDPDEPGDVLLNFATDGKLVEVLQGATVVFSRTVTDSGSGSGGGSGEVCTDEDTQLDLDVVGPVGGAKGDTRYREQAADCDKDFSVQIEDLPLGDYSLVVGGTVRGTITVANVLGNIQGEIQFDTEPNDPGELLLTFDPSGQLIEIVQGATVYLSVTLP